MPRWPGLKVTRCPVRGRQASRGFRHDTRGEPAGEFSPAAGARAAIAAQWGNSAPGSERAWPITARHHPGNGGSCLEASSLRNGLAIQSLAYLA